MTSSAAATIVLDTPEIAAAREALAAGRAHRAELSARCDEAQARRDACPTGKGSRTLRLAYSAALNALDEYAQGDLDYLRRDVEMAVRVANLGVSQAEIMMAVRGL